MGLFIHFGMRVNRKSIIIDKHVLSLEPSIVGSKLIIETPHGDFSIAAGVESVGLAATVLMSWTTSGHIKSDNLRVEFEKRLDELFPLSRAMFLNGYVLAHTACDDCGGHLTLYHNGEEICYADGVDDENQANEVVNAMLTQGHIDNSATTFQFITLIHERQWFPLQIKMSELH